MIDDGARKADRFVYVMVVVVGWNDLEMALALNGVSPDLAWEVRPSMSAPAMSLVLFCEAFAEVLFCET